MLWFNHRKPVGTRKPVAVLAPQHIDAPNTLAQDSPAANLSSLHGSGGAVALALEFSVRYGLPEYVSFMWQHARYLIRRRRIGVLAGCAMLVKSTWLAGFHFVVQGRWRHTYGFTIDQYGIVRTGPGGVTLIGWEDVSAIRSYSRGRLLVLKRGTLPIPARCLSRQQADGLAAYAQFAASIRAAGAP